MPFEEIVAELARDLANEPSPSGDELPQPERYPRPQIGPVYYFLHTL